MCDISSDKLFYIIKHNVFYEREEIIPMTAMTMGMKELTAKELRGVSGGSLAAYPISVPRRPSEVAILERDITRDLIRPTDNVCIYPIQ